MYCAETYSISCDISFHDWSCQKQLDYCNNPPLVTSSTTTTTATITTDDDIFTSTNPTQSPTMKHVTDIITKIVTTSTLFTTEPPIIIDANGGDTVTIDHQTLVVFIAVFAVLIICLIGACCIILICCKPISKYKQKQQTIEPNMPPKNPVISGSSSTSTTVSSIPSNHNPDKIGIALSQLSSVNYNGTVTPFNKSVWLLHYLNIQYLPSVSLHQYMDHQYVNNQYQVL